MAVSRPNKESCDCESSEWKIIAIWLLSLRSELVEKIASVRHQDCSNQTRQTQVFRYNEYSYSNGQVAGIELHLNCMGQKKDTYEQKGEAFLTVMRNFFVVSTRGR
jgi:hypothetical protein